MFLIVFHSFPTFLCQKSESLLFPFAQLLLFKDRWDRFALVALYKRAIRSFAQSQKTSVSLEKTDYRIPNPESRTDFNLFTATFDRFASIVSIIL